MMTRFHPDFWTLTISQFLSKIGDFAHDIVFVLLVLELAKGDYFLVGLVYFCKFVPFPLFGPIGGTMADLCNRKYIMLLSDSIRCILTFGLAIIFIIKALNFYILILFAFLFTFFRVFFQPAYQVALLDTLKKEELIKGNSIAETCTQIASIIAPLICSLLIAFSNKGVVLLLDAITFLISTLLIIRLKSTVNIVEKVRSNLINIYANSFKHIIKISRSSKLFTAIVYSSICIFFASSLIRFILPAHILKISYGKEAYVGYVMTVISIGSVIGAIAFAKLRKAVRSYELLLYWVIYGITFLTIGLSTHMATLLLLSFILGISGVIVDIALVYDIQTNSQPNDVGKNFGGFSTLANTAESTSGLITGLIMQNITTTFVSMAVLLVVVPSSKLIKQLLNYKTGGN